MAVNLPLPPPTSGLPQLPVSKLRSPSAALDTSRISSASPTTPKPALRTPSRVQKPPSSLTGGHATSSPSIPTLRSVSAHQTPGQEEDADREVRRSVSIANFPQPPKIQRRTGVESKYSSAAYYQIPDSSRATERRAPQLPRGSESSDSQSANSRLKRLKSKTSNSAIGQMYSAGPTPTLLNGSGNGKAIRNLHSETRGSNDLASLQSPTHSRSSSAQGSYSTSATTFEEGEERRGRDGIMDEVKIEARKRDSGKEGKGNVIVSVRIRPDAGEDRASRKDWLVDGRQSLVAYRGREGGDYYFGKYQGLLEVILISCGLLLLESLFGPSELRVDCGCANENFDQS